MKFGPQETTINVIKPLIPQDTIINKTNAQLRNIICTHYK